MSHQLVLANPEAAAQEPLAMFFNVFSNICVHCHLECSGHHRFIALGPPYHGLLHVQCAHWFAYNDQWPHPYAAITYESQKSSSQLSKPHVPL